MTLVEWLVAAYIGIGLVIAAGWNLWAWSGHLHPRAAPTIGDLLVIVVGWFPIIFIMLVEWLLGGESD